MACFRRAFITIVSAFERIVNSRSDSPLASEGLDSDRCNEESGSFALGSREPLGNNSFLHFRIFRDDNAVSKSFAGLARDLVHATITRFRISCSVVSSFEFPVDLIRREYESLSFHTGGVRTLPISVRSSLGNSVYWKVSLDSGRPLLFGGGGV